MWSRCVVRISLASLVVGLLAGCGGAEERKAEYFSRGKQYFDEKNFEKAKVEFKNALQIDPKMPKPYLYLGQIEESKQNWRESFGLYQKAAELDPNDIDTKIKLAKFYMLAKEKGKVEALVGEILQARPGDVDGLMLKATLLNADGNRDGAIRELEAVTNDHAKTPEAFLLLAMLYSQKGDEGASEAALERGLTANPGDKSLLTTLAKLYVQLKKPERAEEILKQLVTQDPANLEFRAGLVGLYSQMKRPADAERVLRDAIQADPKDVRRYTMLAEFLTRNGQANQAIQELENAVKASPELPALRFALGQLYEALRQPQEAEKVYAAIVDDSDSKPDVLKAKDRLAMLASLRGDNARATALIDEVLKESPQDYQALYLQGRLALAQKEPQKAIASFRAILKDQPDAVEILALIASAHQLDGKPALAQESLEKAVLAKPEDFGVRKRLIELLVQQKNLAAAQERTDEYLKLSPKNLDALNLKADLLALESKQETLEKLLLEIKADFPDKAVGPFRLGQFYQIQKKPEAALQEFEASLARSDGAYEPLQAIVGVYLNQKQPEKAIARLKRVLEKKPNDATAYQLQGLSYMAMNKPEAAIKSLKRAMELNPRWPVPYANIATIYVRRGDFDSAVKVYEDALQRFPDNADILTNLAHIHEAGSDFPAAIERYEALIAKKPNNLVAINNLAALLSLDGNDQLKLARAVELSKRLENSAEPAFMDTVAWIHYQTGDYDKALPLLQKAAEKVPQNPIFQYHLGMTLLKRGDKPAAKEHLTLSTKAGRDFPGLQQAKEALKSLD